MGINKNFGKVLEDGSLRYAPSAVAIIDRRSYTTQEWDEYDENGEGIGDPHDVIHESTVERVAFPPTADDYRRAKTGPYLPIEDDAESCPDGMTVASERWVSDGQKITVVREFKPLPEPTPVARRWTPLTLKRGAVAKGWWDEFKGILNLASGYEDFLMCQFVSEDDPMFQPIYNALCATFGTGLVDEYLSELPTEG